jgi:superfamily II RNA helicase
MTKNLKKNNKSNFLISFYTMSLTTNFGQYTGDLKFNYPFELSDFQKNAIQAWFDKKHSIICAPTGCGKTLPAEHIMNNIINNNLGKVIYTTPIKALTNDKHRDLQKKIPNGDIGILTGDRKFNPNGNVLVMTTEILRNLLYTGKIEDVQNKITIKIDMNEIHTVIFDEVHYMGDKHRGMVWEECFILLSKRILLVNLSATIENPEHFGNWLSKIKQTDVVLTGAKDRIVPLEHAIYLDYLPSFLKKKAGASSEKFNNAPIVFSKKGTPFDTKLYTDTVNHVKKTYQGLSRTQIINNIIEYLDLNMLTPAIFFIFSRKGCEKIANKVSHNLLRENEPALVDKLVHDYLRTTDNYQKYIKLQQFSHLKKCLDKGFAYHHSGLLPVFKELVEMLFGHKDPDGKRHPLVKVLFATETFAVGVNFPNKTVIFTSLEKYSDGGMRYLETHEYLQMAGRAGRRGIDKKGLVLHLLNKRNLPEHTLMKNLILGTGQVLTSRFRPNYKIITKALLNGNSLEDIIANSLINVEIESDIQFNKAALSKIILPDIDISQFSEYEKIKNNNYGFIRPSKKTIKANQKKLKKWQNDSDFMEAYSQYLKSKDIFLEKERLLKRVDGDSKYIQSQLQVIKVILEENDYIKDNTLQVKAIISSEINECNEILLTELITSNLLDNLDFKELGAVLSLFGDSKLINKNNFDNSIDNSGTKLSEQYKFKTIIEHVTKTAIKWNNLETMHFLDMNYNWEINKEAMNATYEWLDGSDFNTISRKYNIYEGNLIKDFLKIFNLAASLRTISEHINNPQLSITSSQIMDIITRDEVSIESLYIN